MGDVDDASAKHGNPGEVSVGGGGGGDDVNGDVPLVASVCGMTSVELTLTTPHQIPSTTSCVSMMDQPELLVITSYRYYRRSVLIYYQRLVKGVPG